MGRQVCTRNDIKTSLCGRDLGEFPLSPPCAALFRTPARSSRVCATGTYWMHSEHFGIHSCMLKGNNIGDYECGRFLYVPSVLRATARRTVLVAKNICGVQPL